MRKDDLDILLRETTDSERNHLKHKFYSYERNENPTPKDENGRFLFHFSHFLPDDGITLLRNERYAQVPEHVHDYIEINYMYSGKCIETINGVPYSLKRGQMTLIDTKTPHSIGYTGDNDLMINIAIRKEYISNHLLNQVSQKNLLTTFFLNALGQHETGMNYILFDSESNERIQLFLHELILEYYEPSSHSKEILNSLFFLVILEMIEGVETGVTHFSLGKTNELLFKAIQYIEAHFESCTLNDTANALSINPSYLTTLLKKNTGQSFKAMVIDKRMRKAAELLKRRQNSIEEIADACGYHNLTFFYRKFKDYYKMTPHDYQVGHHLKEAPAYEKESLDQ